MQYACATTFAHRRQQNGATDGTHSQDADACPAPEATLLDCIDSDGQRFGKGRRGQAEVVVDLEAVLLRHHEVFGQAALRLSGTAEKLDRTTRVLTSGTALVAPTARHSRLDRDAVAHSHSSHFAAHLEDRSSAFVPDRERVFDNLTSDASGGVVMNVRTTHSQSA